MSDEEGKASEVGKPHFFNWCIVVAPAARLPPPSHHLNNVGPFKLNTFGGNLALLDRDETQSSLLPWVLSLLCARLKCIISVWCIKINSSVDATSELEEMPQLKGHFQYSCRLHTEAVLLKQNPTLFNNLGLNS